MNAVIVVTRGCLFIPDDGTKSCLRLFVTGVHSFV
jgi:hypothetical protein